MLNTALAIKYPSIVKACTGGGLSPTKTEEYLHVIDQHNSRIELILSHPEAVGRRVLAETLAYKTSCSLEESVQILRKQRRTSET